jgi:hypothetical protein
MSSNAAIASRLTSSISCKEPTNHQATVITFYKNLSEQMDDHFAKALAYNKRTNLHQQSFTSDGEESSTCTTPSCPSLVNPTPPQVESPIIYPDLVQYVVHPEVDTFKDAPRIIGQPPIHTSSNPYCTEWTPDNSSEHYYSPLISNDSNFYCRLPMTMNHFNQCYNHIKPTLPLSHFNETDTYKLPSSYTNEDTLLHYDIRTLSHDDADDSSIGYHGNTAPRPQYELTMATPDNSIPQLLPL